LVYMKKPKKNISLDQLAAMVAEGFEHTASKEGQVKLEVKVDKLETRMNRLEQGQEEIKLRLDGVAYRFELMDLQKRVQLLEKRVGFSR